MEIKVLASGSTGNCYLVRSGQSSLLLDAGIPAKRIREGCDYRLSQISGCLVTHSHGDHCKAVKDLLAASVPVYMPEKEIAAAGFPAHHRLHPLKRRSVGFNAASPQTLSYEVFEAGTFAVRPFQTFHDTPEPVGYFIAGGEPGTVENLLYFTDTYYLQGRFRNLNYIIGECNYDSETMWEKVESGETPAARAKRLFSTHMSLNHFLDFLKCVENPETIRQIYICHMSDDHGNEANIREAVQRLTGAEVYVC